MRATIHNPRRFVLRILVSILATILVGCCPNCPENQNLSAGAGGISPPVNGPLLSVVTSSCAGPPLATNAKLVVQFSNPLNAATLTPATFLVSSPGPVGVSGAFALDLTGKIVTFTPTVPFAANTSFILVITPGVKDLNGVSLPTSFICRFSTTGGADADAPAVISNFPTCGLTNVALDQLVSVTFDGDGTARDNQPMDPTTIDGTTFTVTSVAGPVAGTVAYDATTNVATFTPAANLTANTVFTITVTTGVRDVSGNPLPAPFTCSFTTGNTAMGIRVVNTPCNTFTILAGSTVTNTGSTRIAGNVGLSPGSSVTGFPPGVLTGGGMIRVDDSLVTMAKTALTAAYNDAVSRPNAVTLTPSDLGGRTLTPGVYQAPSSVQILNGNLILDGKGDPNAVFIFQIGTSLTTNSGSQVILINGAQHANVFWAVGSSATLGTNSVFQGIILAQQSITLTTGVVLDGCALAQTGAVTLDTNTVSGM